MAEIKVNINGIDDALDRLKKLETLCKSASMKKIPHGDVSGQVINQLQIYPIFIWICIAVWLR